MSKQSEQKSVSEKMNELSKLVAWFEGDDFELEQALDTYGKAEQLATEIEHDLVNLKNEITVLKEKFDT